jgi:hypothetical protein
MPTLQRGSEIRLCALAMDESGRYYLVMSCSDTAAVEPTTPAARVQAIAQTLQDTAG